MSTEENPPKKQKLEEPREPSDENEKLKTLEGFEIVKILNESAKTKSVFVQGRFEGSDDAAVVILEKTAFDEKSLPDILSKDSNLVNTLKNDIYGTYKLMAKPEVNDIKTTVIHPATEKHIAKYTAQEMFLVTETGEDYSQITLPYIEGSTFSVKWVYNILEKKKEAERIVFEDSDPETGFILLPDMKWDGKNVEELYLVAICHRHGIRSLRDLDSSHLPLLKNILKNAQKAIFEKYQVPASKLRAYFHYQPSYYHLHIHFTHLRLEAPGSGCDRGHMLTEVIRNIEISGDHYSKATLTFTVRENDGLYKKYKENGKL